MVYRKKRKTKFQPDAKIIWGLMKEQPLTFEKLREKSNLSESRFYDTLKFFIEKGKIKDIAAPQLRKNGKPSKKGKYKRGIYTLYNYTDLEYELERIFVELKNRPSKYLPVEKVSLDYLANAVGKPPEKIREVAYKLAKKYHMTIAPITTPKMKSVKRKFG